MNKKGVTLIEILITIVLISSVLLLFTRLLIHINKLTNESNESNKFKLNQSIVNKMISNDLLKNSSNITSVDTVVQSGTDYKRISIERKTDYTEPGECHNLRHTYIDIYENKIHAYKQIDVVDEKPENSNVCGGEGPYIIKTLIYERDIPEKVKYLLQDISVQKECSNSTSDLNNCAFLIKIPAVDSNNNHYDIEIPGTYKSS